MNKSWQYATRLAVSYLVIAGVYILVSGSIASGCAGDVAELERFEVYKGILFVGVTAGLLFVLALRLFRRAEENVRNAASARHAFVVAQRRATAGLFASSVAHDLRNILTVVGMVSDRLRPSVPEKDLRWLDDLDTASERARELARRLMMVGQDVSPHADMADLTAVGAEVLGLVRAHRAARSRELRLVAEGPVPLLCQPALVHQMLTNLVLNAVQATGERGTVEVSLSGNAQEAVIIVDDDGPGIPEAQRAQLFEPFYTTRNDGMGLGLFSVSACVESHGGTVTVSRSRLGGACFRIVLRASTSIGADGPQCVLPV